MLTDNPNADNGTDDTERSQGEPGNQGLTPPQRSPASKPTTDDKNEAKNKPRLLVRLWRIHRKRQKSTSPPNVAEKITVFLILVTAFIGGVQARIYYQQKKIMESSGTQTQQLITAAQIQAGAAERFAASASQIQTKIDAAEKDFSDMAGNAADSLKQTQQSFHAEQRAWIGAVVGPVDLNSKPPKMTVYVTNTGKTPAFKVTHISNGVEGAWGQESPFLVMKEPTTAATASHGTLPPGFPMKVQFEIRAVDPSGIITTNQRGKYLVVYSGRFTYEDAFKTPHWSNYCFYVTGPMYAINSDVPATFCPYGNDTDDNPEKRPPSGTKVYFP